MIEGIKHLSNTIHKEMGQSLDGTRVCILWISAHSLNKLEYSVSNIEQKMLMDVTLI